MRIRQRGKFDGNPCKCGRTTRYYSNGKCCHCHNLESVARRKAKKQQPCEYVVAAGIEIPAPAKTLANMRWSA